VDIQFPELYGDIPTVNVALAEYERHLLAEYKNNSKFTFIKWPYYNFITVICNLPFGGGLA